MAEKEKLYKNKAWLYDQIKNKTKTSEQIANELGVHVNTITKWRKTFNIPTSFKDIPITDKMTLPKYEDVHKEIKAAGGIGIWAQKEAIELFCFSKYLLDQVNKILIQLNKEGHTGQWITGLFKAITQLSKCAAQLKEIMPSRSSIGFSDPTHRVSKEDEEAVNVLNSLLSVVKEDIEMNTTSKNIKGWYSPNEEVPIKMPHESHRN